MSFACASPGHQATMPVGAGVHASSSLTSVFALAVLFDGSASLVADTTAVFVILRASVGTTAIVTVSLAPGASGFRLQTILLPSCVQPLLAVPERNVTVE